MGRAVEIRRFDLTATDGARCDFVLVSFVVAQHECCFVLLRKPRRQAALCLRCERPCAWQVGALLGIRPCRASFRCCARHKVRLLGLLTCADSGVLLRSAFIQSMCSKAPRGRVESLANHQLPPLHNMVAVATVRSSNALRRRQRKRRQRPPFLLLLLLLLLLRLPLNGD